MILSTIIIVKCYQIRYRTRDMWTSILSFITASIGFVKELFSKGTNTKIYKSKNSKSFNNINSNNTTNNYYLDKKKYE